MLNLSVAKRNPIRKKVRSLMTARIVLPTAVSNLLLVGEAFSENGPEAETCGDTALSTTVAAAPGGLVTYVARYEGVVATQTMKSTPVTAGAIVVRNSLSVADLFAGATFTPPYLVPYPDHVLIGGFSVPANYAALYTKIWESYRHVAMTKRITGRLALVKRVEEALSSIDDMCNVTGHTVSEDVILSWKFHCDMCVDFEFNAP